MITGPTTGVIETSVKELRVELQVVETAIKGEHFSMAVPEKIRRSDKLFKLVDAKTVSDNVRK